MLAAHEKSFELQLEWDLFTTFRCDGSQLHFALDGHHYIERVSDRAAQALGFSCEEFDRVRAHFVSLSHPGDTAKLRAKLWQVASDSSATPFTMQELPPLRHRFMTSYGRYVWLESVFVQGAMRPNTFLVSSVVLPDMDENQSDLNCEDELAASSFNIRMNTERSVVFVSPASCIVLGYHALQLFNVDLMTLVRHSDRDRFVSMLDEASQTIGKQVSLVVDLMHADGHFLRCSVFCECDVTVADDKVSEWRFLCANVSVLSYAPSTAQLPVPQQRPQPIEPEWPTLVTAGPPEMFSNAWIVPAVAPAVPALTLPSIASTTAPAPAPVQAVVPKPKTTTTRRPKRADGPKSPGSPLARKLLAHIKTEGDLTTPNGKKRSIYRPSKRTDKSCEFCHKTESPEWRRGPGGANSLCNACGIRFAKLRRQRQIPSAGAPPAGDVPAIQLV